MLTASLRRKQPNSALTVKCANDVHQAISEITVVRTPPQHHHVSDRVLCLVQHLTLSGGLDGLAEVFVDILIPAKLLDKLPSFKS